MRVWILASLLCGLLPVSYAATTWQTVQNGLAVTTISQGFLQVEPTVIAYRINPQYYHFQIASGDPTAFVYQIGEKNAALIAINGGYFSPAAKPLGLRISNFRKLTNKKNISWWGIFYLADGLPAIVASDNWQARPNIAFAIQAGPRLLIHGKIVSLKAGKAQRSAICITGNQQIMLAVTKNNALTLTAWAKTLRNLGCLDALNLDGGTSSQLYSALPNHSYQAGNYKPVTDAIIVTANP